VTDKAAAQALDDDFAAKAFAEVEEDRLGNDLLDTSYQRSPLW
jgi:hypothetical protein